LSEKRFFSYTPVLVSLLGLDPATTRRTPKRTNAIEQSPTNLKKTTFDPPETGENTHDIDVLMCEH